jgi:uncharacterized protein (TIGR02145 family)
MQGTTKEINGTDILHLSMTTTGIETALAESDKKISFSPNPMTNYTRMIFAIPEGGETSITLFDNSGRRIADKKDMLRQGRHIYLIEGIKEGVYLVKVSTGRYSCSGKFISTDNRGGTAKITYMEASISTEKKSISEGTKGDVIMEYFTGDRLKITAISGNYSTVVTDIPTVSKTITFNFVACSDGNNTNYPVVQIGTQLWMAANLSATNLNDGTVIQNVTDGVIWSDLSTPAYCWYDNQIQNKLIYGALYNWFVVGTGKICPAGWHVPSDEEWTTLVAYLGGEAVAGGKLKETTNAHWLTTSTTVTNSTGFTALPGGYRYYAGNFGSITWDGIWWTSTDGPATHGFIRGMNHGYITVGSINTYKKDGNSIRCIKN